MHVANQEGRIWAATRIQKSDERGQRTHATSGGLDRCKGEDKKVGLGSEATASCNVYATYCHPHKSGNEERSVTRKLVSLLHFRLKEPGLHQIPRCIFTGL